MLFPIVGVVRGATDQDLTDRCAATPNSTCARANPPPVEYPATIIENALVGVLFDVAALLVVSAWAPAGPLDPTR